MEFRFAIQNIFQKHLPEQLLALLLRSHVSPYAPRCQLKLFSLGILWCLRAIHVCQKVLSYSTVSSTAVRTVLRQQHLGGDLHHSQWSSTRLIPGPGKQTHRQIWQEKNGEENKKTQRGQFRIRFVSWVICWQNCVPEFTQGGQKFDRIDSKNDNQWSHKRAQMRFFFSLRCLGKRRHVVLDLCFTPALLVTPTLLISHDPWMSLPLMCHPTLWLASPQHPTDITLP